MSARNGLQTAVTATSAASGSLALWFAGRPRVTRCDGRLSLDDACRMKGLIENTIGDVFGVSHADLVQPSRGKAPVALARQAAMYLAHGMSLTDVGIVFARDRTTVAHACAVIEDRRDDPAFDRALELLEWVVCAIVGPDPLHAARLA